MGSQKLYTLLTTKKVRTPNPHIVQCSTVVLKDRLCWLDNKRIWSTCPLVLYTFFKKKKNPVIFFTFFILTFLHKHEKSALDINNHSNINLPQNPTIILDDTNFLVDNSSQALASVPDQFPQQHSRPCYHCNYSSNLVETNIMTTIFYCILLITHTVPLL